MPIERPIDASPEEIRAILRPLRNDFSVAVVAAGNPFAVGAIIRVAHSYLAHEILIVGEETWYPKASMGMHKYEAIVHVPSLGELARALDGRPLWAIEKDSARRSLDAVDEFPKGVVFAFGSERFGLPVSILDAAHEVVGIPLYGVNHSLPVAVCAGIVLHEWARSRYRDGTVI
jgi:tRNA G18 (ribose-2'-O)-methylase SpoU